MKSYFYRFLVFLSVILYTYSCIQDESSKGLDLSVTPEKVTLFAPGIISGPQYERDLAISPDGNQLLYTLYAPRNAIAVIMHCIKTGDNWSEPKIASFSGRYTDLEPAFDPGGKQLYFASNRPVDPDSTKTDFDIWKVAFIDGLWGEPVNLGSPINTLSNEFYPSVAANGNLYFTASYTDSKGSEDIYMSEWENNAYNAPLSLDSTINTPTFEFNAYVSADESYLIFSSFGRPDGMGGGDLYIAVKNKNGSWGKATNIGEEINSTFLDYSPFVYKNILYFTSERHKFTELQIPLTTAEFHKRVNSPENGNGDLYMITLLVN